MIGNNDLILNQATMCTAVQHWLNACILQDNMKVAAIEESGGDLFKVTLVPESKP